MVSASQHSKHISAFWNTSQSLKISKWAKNETFLGGNFLIVCQRPPKSKEMHWKNCRLRCNLAGITAVWCSQLNGHNTYARRSSATASQMVLVSWAVMRDSCHAPIIIAHQIKMHLFTIDTKVSSWAFPVYDTTHFMAGHAWAITTFLALARFTINTLDFHTGAKSILDSESQRNWESDY